MKPKEIEQWYKDHDMEPPKGHNYIDFYDDITFTDSEDLLDFLAHENKLGGQGMSEDELISIIDEESVEEPVQEAEQLPSLEQVIARLGKYLTDVELEVLVSRLTGETYESIGANHGKDYRQWAWQIYERALGKLQALPQEEQELLFDVPQEE